MKGRLSPVPRAGRFRPDSPGAHAPVFMLTPAPQAVDWLERVVLTVPMPDEGLALGDIGTVVHIHQGREAYEVEFMTLAGETIALATLSAAQVRPLARRDMAHSRELSIT